jgi:L-arabinose transport system substrate-binding protein
MKRMSTTRRLLFGFLLMLISMFALACTSQDTPQGKEDAKKTGTPAAGKVKIGFVVKMPEAAWFQWEWRFADQAAKELGFDLVKLPATDNERVLSVIDTMATQGVKGFVICTPDVRLGPQIVRKAAEKGMKVLAVDDQFVGPDGKFMTEVPYLGISARKIGENVGKELWADMQKRGWKPEETGACVITLDELDTTKDRTDGAISSLTAAGFPADRVFKAPEKTHDIVGANDAASIVLTQHPDIKYWLVAGANDDAVLGPVRAMETRGLGAENVIGIGINGTECISELEKEKPTGFFGSMLLQPKIHGHDTAKMMYEWVAKGIEPPKDTRTVGILITRENFKQVFAEQGLADLLGKQ